MDNTIFSKDDQKYTALTVALSELLASKNSLEATIMIIKEEIRKLEIRKLEINK